MYIDDFPHKAHLARGFSKKLALCEAQNWRCCYCGISFSDDPQSDARATVEHVIPVIAGGLRIWSNEVVACALCNEGRGAMQWWRYFNIVTLRGRRKAYRWGLRQWAKARQRKAAEKAIQGTMQAVVDHFGIKSAV
jgi:5-methylcytosine-specific restriction endonuclease McrA